MRPSSWQRTVAVAACAAALVACSGGSDPNVGEVEQADSGYITCDDLIIWRADYGEIGEAVTYDSEIPDAIFDPDPTPFIGQLRCPPPSYYEYDTELVVINLYWSADPPPDAPYPDAWVLADAPHDAGGDASDAGGDASDAGGDAYDGPLADAAPVDAADAGFDAGFDAGGPDGGGWLDAAVADAGGSGDAGGGQDAYPGQDGGIYVEDAAVTYGGVMYMLPPPQGGGKPVQPRPVVPARPGPPVTQVPLPPGATKPPPRVVEPQAVRTPAAAVTPRFIDPALAIQQTSVPAYRAQLWTELLLLDPVFGVRGGKVNMGYWSGNGKKNVEALKVLLDDINTNGGPKVRAFFDEGTGTAQLPSYRAMNRADWYGRAKLVDGKGSLDGGLTKIVDPHPVTLSQANTIWGQFSIKYAQMALDAHSATGNVVDVWCFVENAAIDRVFYKYELPVLKDLEALGVVRVHFAKKLDAKYNVPADWIVGTANAPPAGPPVNPPPLGPP